MEIDKLKSCKRNGQNPPRRRTGKGSKAASSGEKTARERLDLLLDPGSFQEIGQLSPTVAPNSAWKSRKPLGKEWSPAPVSSTDAWSTFTLRILPSWEDHWGDARSQDLPDHGFGLKTGAPLIGINDPEAPASKKGWTP